LRILLSRSSGDTCFALVESVPSALATEFPKTYFVVKAEAVDYTRMEDVSHEELVSDVIELGNELKDIPFSASW
jgi:hypothetical protein